MLSLGSILYVSLLLINAMAVLSEDRFLARSALPVCSLLMLSYSCIFRCAVGWASTQVQAGQAGYGQGYAQPYDQQGQDVGMKGRLINLISAVRTLMRSAFHFSIVLRNS